MQNLTVRLSGVRFTMTFAVINNARLSSNNLALLRKKAGLLKNKAGLLKSIFFFEKSCENVWWFQIFFVTLQRNKRMEWRKFRPPLAPPNLGGESGGKDHPM